MPQENVDSRDLKSVFAFKAQDIDEPCVITGKGCSPLYSIIGGHPAFRTGCKNPYFKEERFILPDAYEIRFWSQDPQMSQIYSEKADIDKLVRKHHSDGQDITGRYHSEVSVYHSI